jgi:hypothetical protein
MDDFIFEKFGGQNIWQPLRENFKTGEKFVKACHHKLDGLRILQFLKWRNIHNQNTDEENLASWFRQFYPVKIPFLQFDLMKFTFSTISVNDLDSLRNILLGIEEEFQIEQSLKPLC